MRYVQLGAAFVGITVAALLGALAIMRLVHPITWREKFTDLVEFMSIFTAGSITGRVDTWSWKLLYALIPLVVGASLVGWLREVWHLEKS